MAAMSSLRRSTRAASSLYDSNGRDYLAAEIGFTRQELTNWLLSSTVHPHLLVWYNLCISRRYRFNDAVEWINTGEKGYFYNTADLEEDLLLMCLAHSGEREGEDFASKAQTSHWITQQLWARTAWRIVQGNCGEGAMFETVIDEHPAKAYAFVIDIICIAFHSIAFRGKDSIWEAIIRDANPTLPPTPSIGLSNSAKGGVCTEVELDKLSGSGSDEPVDVEEKSEALTAISFEPSDNGDSTNPASELETAPSSPLLHGRGLKQSGSAKRRERDSKPDSEVVVVGKRRGCKSRTSGTRDIREWLQGSSVAKSRITITGNDVDLQTEPELPESTMVDESGVPITGYTKATAI